MNHKDEMYSLWNIFNNYVIFLYVENSQKIQTSSYKIDKY